jgi:hypothetical protein
MSIQDHNTEISDTVFWVKILKFFDSDADPESGIFLTLDPGWKKFRTGILGKHPGSATLQFTKNYRTFTQTIVIKLSKIWFGILLSSKNLFRIPDPGVKKAPDPGSATLHLTNICIEKSLFYSSWLHFLPSLLHCQPRTVKEF